MSLDMRRLGLGPCVGRLCLFSCKGYLGLGRGSSVSISVHGSWIVCVYIRAWVIYVYVCAWVVYVCVCAWIVYVCVRVCVSTHVSFSVSCLKTCLEFPRGQNRRVCDVCVYICVYEREFMCLGLSRMVISVVVYIYLNAYAYVDESN